MRILFAAAGYKPAYRIGGPAVSVSALAESLVRKGHEVTVFTTNSNMDRVLDVPVDQPVDVDGVRVWYFRKTSFVHRWLPFVPYVSRSIGMLYAPKMAEALRQVTPTVDVVHTHLPFVYPTYAAAKAARTFGKPLFYHQRGVLDPVSLRFRALKKAIYLGLFERPILKQAAALIALSQAEVDSYRAQVPDARCSIVPNGIDATRYRQDPSGDGPRRLGVPEDATVVLFLGRLHPHKGADKLLDAFTRIQGQAPRAVLVMAGPDEWGLESKFRRSVREAKLLDRVIFPGMVTGDDKLDLLARADLLCLPSASEGFSMAVLEALASACPVLLSPGCHFPEVERAGAGRIVSADPEPLSRALLDLLLRPETLREMGRKGLDYVSRSHRWDVIAEHLIDVYRQGLYNPA